MERVTGIEPASPAWKAGALAIVLHPHAPSVEIVSLVIIAHAPPHVKKKIVSYKKFFVFFIAWHKKVWYDNQADKCIYAAVSKWS